MPISTTGPLKAVKAYRALLLALVMAAAASPVHAQSTGFSSLSNFTPFSGTYTPAGTTTPTTVTVYTMQANPMVTDFSGSVGIGIGTATPFSTLHISPVYGPTAGAWNLNTGVIISGGLGGTALNLGIDDNGSWIQSTFVNAAQDYMSLNLQPSGGGEVGINTETPSTTLSLGKWTPYTVRLAVWDNGPGSTVTGIGYDGVHGSMTFGVNIDRAGTPQMALAGNGLLGIGTATPGYPLHVVGADGFGYQDLEVTDPSGVHLQFGNSAGYNASGSPWLTITVGTTADAWATANESIVGNLGSYVTLAALNNTSGQQYMQIGNTSSGSNDLFVIQSLTNGGVYVNATPFTLADNAPSNSLVIGSTGYVGIGTASPAKPLHVYTATAGAAVAEFQNGTGQCSFTPATSGNGTWSCSSDARLKKDIVDSGDALSWIGSIRVRDYTMKSDGSRQTGVIAQEMLKDNPDMVHMGKDGFYTVDSPDPWKIVKAIQQVKALFDGDHDEIAKLKTANDDQAKAIEDLRAMIVKQQGMDAKTHP